jgi:autotransporter passenger strand-loop-strand repeat protein
MVSGTAIGTTLLSGAIEDNRGITSGTHVNSGAFEGVQSGALASGTVVSGATAAMYISSGGTASGTVVMGGGELFIASGGTGSGATLSRGFELVFGTAIGTTILSGAIEDNRGITSGTHVDSGAFEGVQSGALASGAVVSGAAAALYVSSGGTASGATLSAGCFDVVKSGGIAVSTTIGSGGIEDDQGIARGALVASGGIEIVDSGGTASGTTVMSGGVDVVVSGGTASATTISGGAFMEVRSGGSVGSGTAVTFASGGVLQLDDSVHFGGTVAGFGVPSLLDLRDIAFISGTTSANFVEAPGNTSGTLTVSGGGHVANITLIGQYMASQFHIQNDGAGGTTVSDPPISSGTTFAGAMPTSSHL